MAAKPIIGAHVSAAGGLTNAPENAKRIGADAIQIFGASPRQWRVAERSPEEITAFKSASQKAGLGPTVLHAPYLINLASPNPELRAKSGALLTAHYKIAEETGARGLIFHIGSTRGIEKKAGEAMVIAALKKTIADVPGIALLVIENSAGGGEKIGRTLTEIADIINAVDSPRAAFCFDTAHAFEAGIVTDYTSESVALLDREIATTVGWSSLVAIHANDSKTPWNSGSDRHENIGKGYIGAEGFCALLHSRFADVPWYLEVPGFAGVGPDAENIKILKDLL